MHPCHVAGHPPSRSVASVHVSRTESSEGGHAQGAPEVAVVLDREDGACRDGRFRALPGRWVGGGEDGRSLGTRSVGSIDLARWII